MKLEKKHFQELSNQMFWPGATGSIFWAACTLVAEPKIPFFFDGLPYFSFLLVLTLYLSYEWLAARELGPPDGTVAFFDVLHLWSIVFCAFAASTAKFEYLVVGLCGAYVIAIIGHLKGVFGAAADRPVYWASGANALGIVLLILFVLLWPEMRAWGPVVSYAVTFIVWVWIRHKMLPKSPPVVAGG